MPGPNHSASHALVLSWEQQSPVHIIDTHYSPDLPRLTFHYPAKMKGEIEGHQFILDSRAPKVFVTYNKIDCVLNRIHFHAPAEHPVDGVVSDAEIHLVHKVTKFPEEFHSQYLVIAVLAQLRAPRKGPPKKPKGSGLMDAVRANWIADDGTINSEDLLPVGRADFYKYEGSLTTPPFTEMVSWIVLKEPIYTRDPIPKAPPETARGLQPHNRRYILRNFR